MSCAPEMNITPLPCVPGGGGGSPGDIIVDGCCSPSIATTTLCLPDDCAPISLVIRSGCAECDATPTDPQVIGYVDAVGTFTPGAPPAGARACDGCGDTSPGQQPCASVTTLHLCDIGDTADDCVRFLRHLVIDCDGTVSATSNTDINGDPYTPVNPGDCDDCPCPDEVKTLILCDDVGDGELVRFLRTITYTADGEIVDQVDTELDRVTPYDPVNPGECPCPDGEPCEPQPACARFSGVAGPDVWELPDNVESLTISIICGEITVTDCSGEVTVMAEGCGTISFAAPQGGGCTPNTLCQPFTVDLPEGSAAYFSWIEIGCGDESPGESP